MLAHGAQSPSTIKNRSQAEKCVCPHAPPSHAGQFPVGATSSEDSLEAQVSSSFGTLPPLSAIFLITTLWSQMFIAAESSVSPV